VSTKKQTPFTKKAAMLSRSTIPLAIGLHVADLGHACMKVQPVWRFILNSAC
jgi:hypothetical protein